jgi:hypothetical protein
MVAELLVDPYPGDFEIIVATPATSDTETAASDTETATVGPAAATDQRVITVHARDASGAVLVNAAASAASYPILSVVRQPAGDWIRLVKRAVTAMDVTGAAVVGGSAVAVGLGSAEMAISRAMNSRLGVGPRPSRVGAAKGPVDSVRMVVIQRDAFARAGGFDPAFAGAPGWEMQHRVRRLGGMVWLDPALAVRGRVPGTISELAATFFRMGVWRRRIIGAHPDTSTWRYLVPPTLVAVLVGTVLGGLAGAVLGVGWMAWLTASCLIYALGVAVGVMVAGRDLRFGGRVRMWWAVMVIHLSWGTGFLFGRPR